MTIDVLEFLDLAFMIKKYMTELHWQGHIAN